MEETLKKITEKELNTLREIDGYPDEDIEFFYTILNYNFGDGEIMPFHHVQNFFERKMWIPESFRGLVKSENYLQYYIDTLRVLSLLNRDIDELLDVEIDNLINFHDEISKEFVQEANIESINKFNNSVSSFKKYNFEDEDYQVSLIESVEELDWEGKYMNHCIASYRHIVAGGRYIGFKFFNKKSWERLTLGFTRDNEVLVFDQLKGHSNYPASEESRNMALNFCKRNKIKADPMSYDLIVSK